MEMSTITSTNADVAFYQSQLGNNVTAEQAQQFMDNLQQWMNQMMAMNQSIASQGNDDLKNQIQQS